MKLNVYNNDFASRIHQVPSTANRWPMPTFKINHGKSEDVNVPDVSLLLPVAQNLAAQIHGHDLTAIAAVIARVLKSQATSGEVPP